MLHFSAALARAAAEARVPQARPPQTPPPAPSSPAASNERVRALLREDAALRDALRDVDASADREQARAGRRTGSAKLLPVGERPTNLENFPRFCRPWLGPWRTRPWRRWRTRSCARQGRPDASPGGDGVARVAGLSIPVVGLLGWGGLGGLRGPGLELRRVREAETIGPSREQSDPADPPRHRRTAGIRVVGAAGASDSV